MNRHLLALCAACMAGPAAAGSFIDFSSPNTDAIMHPDSYTGTGGEYVVTICLNPSKKPTPALDPEDDDPEQALRNVAAEFNRLQGTSGNVVNGVVAGVPFGRADFESVAVHELGHCIGLDHNTIGPSEIAELGACDESGATPAPSCFSDEARQLRYFTNSYNGTNAVINVDDGADNARGSRDDARGDDLNRHWFRIGSNDPFEVAGATVDRSTHRVTGFPPGHNFAEVATSFNPCNNPVANTSGLRGEPPTSAAMFPVLCTNNVVRQTSWDDVTTLRIAQSGNDGIAGNADDYTVRMEYVGESSSCDIVVEFESGPGFAFCGVSGFDGSPNQRITTATANFEIAVDWYFNQEDSTGPGAPVDRIFYDGFE